MLMICFATAQTHLERGRWRVVLALNDSTELPFNIDVKERTVDIMNADERITIDEITYLGDSIVLKMPVFDSEIRGKISGDKISGNFINYARTNHNMIPMKAEREEYRFNNLSLPAAFDMTGRWEVVFAGDEPPLNISIGEFEQHDNYLTGTFLTPTGDYRYLEGAVRGNEFWLSCFDGSHLFLFSGLYAEDGNIKGHYYSGSHWHDTWTAKRNKNIALPNPDSLTILKPGYNKISFAFPDVDGNMISTDDKKFQNKILIVQIMGTWCPNCMDETAFLSPFYKKYKERGVEIIGLDFERIDDLTKVKQNLQRLKKRYDIDYTLLYAGSTDPKNKAKALPMFNKIMSFPTTVFIDRTSKIRRIHTGFSGPATGEHFEKWKEGFYSLIDSLLKQ